MTHLRIYRIMRLYYLTSPFFFLFLQKSLMATIQDQTVHQYVRVHSPSKHRWAPPYLRKWDKEITIYTQNCAFTHFIAMNSINLFCKCTHTTSIVSSFSVLIKINVQLTCLSIL